MARLLPLAILLLLGSASAQEDSLRVLVWNAWRGGNEVTQGPEKVLEVIRAADPDVVLMQESYDVDGERPTLGRWVASQLGWSAHQGESPHLCVLAKGPFDTTFFHHPWHGVGVCVRDESGRGFLAWSIWLDHRAYVPYALRDDPNLTDAALIALESEGSQRLPQARSLLAAVLERAKQDPDLPVLVGGDFNTPSHLDWTLDTARTYRFRRALPLPVSLAMHEAHFADTFRQVHPNPVQQPGITWTPLFRGKGAEKPACFDRIDRLYLRPPQAETDWILLPVAAQTLPEVWEDDELPTKERTFPSDHCALLVDLRWVPANR